MADLHAIAGGGNPDDVIDFSDRRDLVRKVRAFRAALRAMVYVHPCQCGDGIPKGRCARCRAVKTLGFDPARPPDSKEQA